MLLLTKLDHSKILVSLTSIKYLEAVPDTLIFFLNGDSIMVRETFAEVMSALQQQSFPQNPVPAGSFVEGTI